MLSCDDTNATTAAFLTQTRDPSYADRKSDAKCSGRRNRFIKFFLCLSLQATSSNSFALLNFFAKVSFGHFDRVMIDTMGPNRFSATVRAINIADMQ